MILTGPEIRARVAEGQSYDEKKNVYKDMGIVVGEGTRGDLCTSMDQIHISPYDPNLVGPNSVDLRLGNKLLVYEGVVKRFDEGGTLDHPVYTDHSYKLDMEKKNKTFELPIPKEGIILRPGILYLGTTIECIGSNIVVPIVEGRSSVGRLGLHVHVTAGFCDLGFKGQITLEIHVIHPIRVYAGIPICQAYFLTPRGKIELYKGRYRDQTTGPVASRIQLSEDEFSEGES